MWDESVTEVFICVFCSARRDTWRGLALISPPGPCRKALNIVDLSGTYAVVSDIVVHESWRQGWIVYSSSATYQIALTNYCISQHFRARIFAFCLLSVFTCFVCFCATLTIISLNSITRFGLSLEMHCVSFEVGSKSLKIIWKKC
jgi:hypothetical protein